MRKLQSIIKNKRAVNVFMVLLMLITITTVFSVWAALLRTTSFGHTIGDDAFALLERYQQGENVLFYVDQLGKHSSQMTIFELAENGGFKGFNQRPPCGTTANTKFRGSQVWYVEPEYCLPDAEKESFSEMFKANLELNFNLNNFDVVNEGINQDIKIKYNDIIVSESNNNNNNNVGTKIIARTNDRIPIKSEQIHIFAEGLDGFSGFPDCNQPASKMLNNGYMDGGNIWIPRQALCGGEFPVIIMLHGHNDGGGAFKAQKVYETAEKLIDERKVFPVILVEPYSKRSSWINDDPWPKSKYIIEEQVKEVRQKLEQYNIKISSVSAIGHSAANCYSGGLRAVAADYDLFLLGLLDPTCNSKVPSMPNPNDCPVVQDYGKPHVDAIEGKRTILFAAHGNKKCSDQKSFPTIAGSSPVDLMDKNQVRDRLRFISGYKNTDRNYYNFIVHSSYYSHGAVIDIGFQELLQQFFAPQLHRGFTASTIQTFNNLQCKLTVFPQDSQSVGSANTNNGKLINGVAMPAPADDLPYVSKVRERERYYATKEFAEIIERTACVMVSSYGYDKLVFNDLSQQGGGRVNGHNSHRSGRDGDFGLYLFEDETKRSINKLHPMVNNPKGSGSLITIPGSSQSMFDVKGSWLLARTFVDVAERMETPVQMIIIHPLLYNKLIQYGSQQETDKVLFEKTKQVLIPDTNEKEHHDHYHIRITCPKGDTECIK